MAARHPKFFLTFFLMLAALAAGAQVPQWTLAIGAGEIDDARVCAIAPNGNVYVAGIFSDVVDLDPSAAVHNITSHGLTDAFLACYTPAGGFLWGVSMGGVSYDGALSLAVDKDNNAIIVGYFSGQNINFDPLGNGKYLTDQGVTGTALEMGGDGYVAKYNAAGTCVWAIDLGGKSDYDNTESVATDERGNVYIGGTFRFTMDMDPGPGVDTINSLKGTAYLIKYTPAGNLVWGFPVGSGGISNVDNVIWSIKAEKGYVYTVGVFQGTVDFDPSPGVTILNTSGTYDGFLAKYDTMGSFQYVKQISGTSNESAVSLVLDSSNIYIAGSTISSSLLFTGGSPLAALCPGGGVNSDMFLVKYSKTGAYVWSEIVGGHGDDAGIGLALKGDVLYVTGYFQDTMDFDPSVAAAYQVSKGHNDIFLCKYNTDGQYICGFGVGSDANDQGRSIACDAQGNLYTCGAFQGINTNFSPTPAPGYLSTHGAADGYLVKYDWQQLPTAPKGYLVGDTICNGNYGLLTFVALNGTAPYTIVFTDGPVADTILNVYSGQQFFPPNNPTETTKYKLTLILSAGNCDPPGYVDTSATVLVYPLPVITVSNDTVVCPGAKVQLHVSVGYRYYWSGTGIDSPTSANPYVVPLANDPCTVTATDSFGCVKTARVQANVYPADFSAGVLAKMACIGDTVQLNASGADSYVWYPNKDTSLSADTGATPIAWPRQNTTYFVAFSEKQCGRRDTLPVHVVVHTLPKVKITQAYNVDCGNKAGMLTVTGADSYKWYPETDISDATSAKPTVHPPVSTWYYVTGSNENGCTGTDSAYIQTFYDGTGRLFAPTAFTPNGDGKNDCFKVNIPGNVTAYEFYIFNRWGQAVFSSLMYGDCWDGTFNGMQQDIGTYYYLYKCISSSCGALEGKGDVQLLR